MSEAQPRWYTSWGTAIGARRDLSKSFAKLAKRACSRMMSNVATWEKRLGSAEPLECPCLGRCEIQVPFTEDFTFLLGCSVLAQLKPTSGSLETTSKSTLKGKSLPAVWPHNRLGVNKMQSSPKPSTFWSTDLQKTDVPMVTWILSRSHLRFDTQSQSNGGPRRGCQRLGGQIFFLWALAPDRMVL